jgi:hypothetical protein
MDATGLGDTSSHRGERICAAGGLGLADRDIFNARRCSEEDEKRKKQTSYVKAKRRYVGGPRFV